MKKDKTEGEKNLKEPKEVPAETTKEAPEKEPEEVPTETPEKEPEEVSVETPAETPLPKPLKSRLQTIKKFLGKSIFPETLMTSVGLDIGSKLIKIVQLTEHSGVITLEKYGIAELPPEVIVDKEVMDREVLIETIKNLVEKTGIEEKKVTILISGKDCIIKSVSTEKLSRGELTKKSEQLAKDNIPFDISEISLDSLILKQEKETTELLLIAAKNESIYTHIDIVRDAGLIPISINSLPLVLENVASVNGYLKDEGISMLLNIGFENTQAVAIRDKIYHSDREILIGTRTFIESLQKLLSINFEQALSLLKGERIKEIKQKDVSKAIQSTLERLGEQLERLFPDILGKENPPEILIGGGGAGIPGIKDFLSKKFATSCEIIDPLRNIHYPQQIPESYDLDIAIGLALPRLFPKKPSINLIPPEERIVEKKRGAEIAQLQLPFLGVIIVFIVLMLLSRHLTNRKMTLEENIENIKVEEKILQNRVNLVQELIQKEKDISAKVSTVGELAEGKYKNIRLLDEINRLLPAYTWLISLEQTETTKDSLYISFQGITTSNRTVSTFMKSLESSLHFKNIKLSYTKKKEIKGTPTTEFEIKALFFE